jgi:hypothetical protein
MAKRKSTSNDFHWKKWDGIRKLVGKRNAKQKLKKQNKL